MFLKLQNASKKEILRLGKGTLICLAAMLMGYAVMVLSGALLFDGTVVLGAAFGWMVALVNFTLLCMTVQYAVEGKNRQAVLRWSYHIRLLFQGAWVLAAFRSPLFHPVAAGLPLLFPPVVIFVLRRKGVPSEDSRGGGAGRLWREERNRGNIDSGCQNYMDN